eukprot:SM017165S03381  [mRNA]  locus=s17165:18:86:- [translate_table: standard]
MFVLGGAGFIFLDWAVDRSREK